MCAVAPPKVVSASASTSRRKMIYFTRLNKGDALVNELFFQTNFRKTLIQKFSRRNIIKQFWVLVINTITQARQVHLRPWVHEERYRIPWCIHQLGWRIYHTMYS